MRRSIWALAVLAVLIVIIAVAVPYIASTRIVRDRIAQEIGAWSGYRVRIEGAPRIDIWPRLRAVLRDVSFSDAGPGGERPIGTVERIDIELSALAAMRGETVFTSARLFKPVLRIGADTERGIWATLAGKGRIRAAIDEAHAAVADQADPASLMALMPSGPFGSVRIEQGTLLLDDGAAAGAPLVTGIAGKVDWPTLDGAGSAVAEGIWRGETIKLDAESAAPMLLFAGGTAPVEIRLDSALGGTSFSGMAKLVGAPFIDGQVMATTASFDRLAGWAGATLPEWENLRSIKLSGTVSGDTSRLKIESAQLQVDGSSGTGAAELTARNGQAAVSGSLAFDTLHLDTLFDTLLPLATQDWSASPAPAFHWLRGLVLDLRLSAASGTAGKIEMSDVAASVQLQDQFDSFDILDASALGGEIQAGLRFDRKADGTLATLRASASRVNGEAFGAAMGMTRLIPEAIGSVAIEMTGRGETLPSAFQNGQGKFSARFGAGRLSAFDLAAFLERNAKGGFFALDETAGGSLAVDGVDVRGTIADGVTTLDKAEARFGERRLWVTGLASYSDRSLALTGGVGAVRDEGAQQPDDTNFFVGGSWGAPFISPVKAGESGN
ncbi:AsmA-like C-terminal region-containing protein [Mesorhizobium sp. CN2-181]